MAHLEKHHLSVLAVATLNVATSFRSEISNSENVLQPILNHTSGQRVILDLAEVAVSQII